MKKLIFRAVQFVRVKSAQLPWYKYMWGCDIWIGRLPVMKLLVLANIIVWIIMFLTRR